MCWVCNKLAKYKTRNPTLYVFFKPLKKQDKQHWSRGRKCWFDIGAEEEEDGNGYVLQWARQCQIDGTPRSFQNYKRHNKKVKIILTKSSATILSFMCVKIGKPHLQSGFCIFLYFSKRETEYFKNMRDDRKRYAQE